LTDYVDDIVHRSRTGEAFRVYEHENRVLRISDARLVNLPNGNLGLAMVLTLGDRRGANPTFVHFARGSARDPERQDGEVKGLSAHCILDTVEHEVHLGRHLMVLEDVPGIGRTPVTRLLCRELREISTGRDERFRNPESGGMNQLRPVIEIWPQKSREMQEALERGTLGTVELYDVGAVPAFDELPEFRVKKRVIRIEVQPSAGGVRGALERLRDIGREQGYGNMKVSWRMRDGQVTSADVRTDLEDLGTALFARRELVSVQTPMSDASDRLNDEFIEALSAHFG